MYGSVEDWEKVVAAMVRFQLSRDYKSAVVLWNIGVAFAVQEAVNERMMGHRSSEKDLAWAQEQLEKARERER